MTNSEQVLNHSGQTVTVKTMERVVDTNGGRRIEVLIGEATASALTQNRRERCALKWVAKAAVSGIRSLLSSKSRPLGNCR